MDRGETEEGVVEGGGGVHCFVVFFCVAGEDEFGVWTGLGVFWWVGVFVELLKLMTEHGNDFPSTFLSPFYS